MTAPKTVLISGRRYLPVATYPELGVLPGLPGPTRASCPEQRPCPYVHCSQNTWTVTGRDRAGRRFNGKTPPTTLRITQGNNCTLDHSAKEMTAAQIGKVLDESPRRVQQRIKSINAKMRAAGLELEAVRDALDLVGVDVEKRRAEMVLRAKR